MESHARRVQACVFLDASPQRAKVAKLTTRRDVAGKTRRPDRGEEGLVTGVVVDGGIVAQSLLRSLTAVQIVVLHESDSVELVQELGPNGRDGVEGDDGDEIIARPASRTVPALFFQNVLEGVVRSHGGE